jgi:hypothetical protein
MLKKPDETLMCSPGHHVVHAHKRVCQSGTVAWVHAHIRKNRGRISAGLLKENIHYLFWNSKKKYSALNPIDGYGNKGADYDELIQFWLEYWKSEGIEFPEKLDPLLIKALIAVESTFDPKAKSKVTGSTASGLMQVTDQMVRVLAGFPNKDDYIEQRKSLIHVKYADKLDPVVNIALGIRLLGHKYSKIPKKNEKNLYNTVKNYHSWDKGGDAYAKEVFSKYEKSVKNK